MKRFLKILVYVIVFLQIALINEGSCSEESKHEKEENNGENDDQSHNNEKTDVEEHTEDTEKKNKDRDQEKQNEEEGQYKKTGAEEENDKDKDEHKKNDKKEDDGSIENNEDKPGADSKPQGSLNEGQNSDDDRVDENKKEDSGDKTNDDSEQHGSLNEGQNLDDDRADENKKEDSGDKTNDDSEQHGSSEETDKDEDNEEDEYKNEEEGNGDKNSSGYEQRGSGSNSDEDKNEEEGSASPVQQGSPIYQDDIVSCDSLNTDIKEVQDLIVSLHNQFRASVDPPAANMLKIEWNEDLRKSSEYWAQFCHLNHSNPKDRTYRGKPNGENVVVSPECISWKLAIEQWNNEKYFFEYGVGPIYEDFVTGHYKQLVTDHTFQCGCAFASCTVDDKFYAYYICQYYPAGNRQSSLYTPYDKGPSCSLCENRCDLDKKLCLNSCRYTNNASNCGVIQKRNLWFLCDNPYYLNNCQATCLCRNKII